MLTNIQSKKDAKLRLIKIDQFKAFNFLYHRPSGLSCQHLHSFSAWIYKSCEQKLKTLHTVSPNSLVLAVFIFGFLSYVDSRSISLEFFNLEFSCLLSKLPTFLADKKQCKGLPRKFKCLWQKQWSNWSWNISCFAVGCLEGFLSPKPLHL